MLRSITKRLFGSVNDRIVKSHQKVVDQINALEPEFEKKSDDDLRTLTDSLRARVAGGESLDQILPEAFANVREGAKRTLGQRHFDVQLIGGIVLHNGQIAEMKTGEGKTLVSTLPVYLNALTGKGVHVVTVNDYLARRDANWMGEIYEFLGLTVGCIVQGLSQDERRTAYAADVTYGTNNEYGFDYLRDNMQPRLDQMVQRPFNFAIVDEVDSILIDEARTPLIISGPTEDNSELYRSIDKLIPELIEGDYEKDEKARSVSLTDDGTEHMERLLADAGLLETPSLYDVENVSVVHHVNQALRAHHLFTRDTDYIVKDDKVIIIDEFTGRMMEGRRYSEGLHQALEAKEDATIQNENQTVASVTYQNYFRAYPKLAGMTGTAVTESAEFGEIYKLDVIDIPTHMPMIRIDNDDEIYRTAEEKWTAVAEQIKECQERKQPVLVGTTSIEKSESLSARLKKAKIKHNVLNARYHEQEAYIIAQAGRPAAVTIATNMAGRGTDIQLGGNVEMRLDEQLKDITDEAKRQEVTEKVRTEIAEAHDEVLRAGGLYVLGTERHESRRIDNQLRGRSGRQGDPGESKFYLSLEDDLMRIFGSERMDTMLRKLGLQEGEAIFHPWINKALEKAQQKVEARNFEIRKSLLRFDDVMNDQRKVIYSERIDIMGTDNVADTVTDMRHDVVDQLVSQHIPEKAYAEQWAVDELREDVRRTFGLDLPIADWAKEEGIADDEIRERLTDAVNRKMAEKAATIGPDIMRQAERGIVLQLLDEQWREHLSALDHLRQGISLRSFAQRDPLNEYKTEAFTLFETMLARYREAVVRVLALLEMQVDPATGQIALAVPASGAHAVAEAFGAGAAPPPDPATVPPPPGEPSPAVVQSTRRAPVNPSDPGTWGKVGRNQACPCGSGKKYKHCHGRV